ncbi:MAG: DUF2849 domain-containing protein [Pseudomonadota bacterium]
MSQTAIQQAAVTPAQKISTGGVKKGRNTGTKVITANDLFSGAVIYWTSERTWTEDMAKALVVSGDDAMAQLTVAISDEGRSVGPYLMDIDEDGSPAGRGKLRERIRDAGPTIHPEFARQRKEA